MKIQKKTSISICIKNDELGKNQIGGVIEYGNDFENSKFIIDKNTNSTVYY